MGVNGWIAINDPRRLGSIMDVLLFFGLCFHREFQPRILKINKENK